VIARIAAATETSVAAEPLGASMEKISKMAQQLAAGARESASFR